jgi:hypothetical protein
MLCDVLDEIQSRPELAQTLLAYGRFRRGDNRQEDRILIRSGASVSKRSRTSFASLIFPSFK